MGRRNRYKKREKKSKDSSNASKAFKNDSFSLKDRKLLIQYLNEYYERCLEVYRGHIFGMSRSKKLQMSDSEDPIVIAGCTFPMLDDDALQEPYLALPSAFSAAQRKIIHFLCVHANLYHVGVKVTEERSYVAISIYRDCLCYLPESDFNPSPRISFLSMNPWLYRMGDSVAAAMKDGHDAVYKLIDQPGKSLRDGIDEIDFEELRDASLAKMLPPRLEDGNWTLVDSPEKLRKCVLEIEADNITEVAFDLECFHRSKVQSMTCLIQLATSSGKEYVVDTLAPGVWDTVDELGPIFSNPKIVKIGHAIAGLDVQSLQRDFGIFIVNAFDTQEAAKALDRKKVGLAQVCASYGLSDSVEYEQLKGVYQACNWSTRPLEKEMIIYARYDVHYLILLRNLMMRDLATQDAWNESNQDAEAKAIAENSAFMQNDFDEEEEEGDGSAPNVGQDTLERRTGGSAVPEAEAPEKTPKKSSKLGADELRMNAALMQVVSKSQEMCVKVFKEKSEPHLKDADFQAIVLASKKGDVDEWTTSQLKLYDELARWRIDMARREKCLPGFICQLGLLVLIAHKRPMTKAALLQLNFRPPEFFDRGDLLDLFELVKASRHDDGLSDGGNAVDGRSYPELLRRLERRKLFRKIAPAAATMVGAAVVAIATVKVLGRRRK